MHWNQEEYVSKLIWYEDNILRVVRKNDSFTKIEWDDDYLRSDSATSELMNKEMWS